MSSDKNNINRPEDKKPRIKVSIQDDAQKELLNVSTTRVQIVSVAVLIVMVIGFGFFALFAWTPLHYILPGYLRSETRMQIIDNAMRLDSLTRQMEMREQYLDNIARILNDEISIDSIAINDSVAAGLDSIQKWSPDILSKSSPESEAFSQEYEENERFNLTMLPPPTEGILFHPPLTGTIVEPFNPQQGVYGISIQASRNATVAAVLDGTIVAITHTLSDGYVLVVQHNNNYMSLYRNIGECMRRVGDKVVAGERIAVIGTSMGSMVEFELWHAGVALNPQSYIVF
ncbi:MAG: M23 family metallopeptidase [Bacteroidaceae bacterium]|nr:M23 family metallopeptidase [Bacteroidaceae bacterium]